METQIEARNLDLPNLVQMLKEQSDVRYDVVVPSSGIATPPAVWLKGNV